jgi:hypothetical protein
MKRTLIICLLVLAPVLCSAQKYGVRTNIIGMATGSLNIEASLTLSNKWTLHLLTQPGARWWLWHSYAGLFIGAQAIGGKYNIAVTDYRYQGWAAGMGVSSGYAWMVTSKWNIEAEVGAGGWYSEYDKYQRPLCGEYEGSFKKILYGPTRASISLMFIF